MAGYARGLAIGQRPVVKQARGRENPAGGPAGRAEQQGALGREFLARGGEGTFSASNLMLGKQAAIESALWAAIVALDERADLARRVAKRLEASGRISQVAHYRREIEAAEQRGGMLRGLVRDLVQGASISDD